MSRQNRNQSPPEITDLDARIAKGGGTSSSLDLLPVNLHEAKDPRRRKPQRSVDDLVRENGYLRQEIVYYKESRNAMLEFHSRVMEAFQVMQRATDVLSGKMALSEGGILEYWGIDLNSDGDNDLTVL